MEAKDESPLLEDSCDRLCFLVWYLLGHDILANLVHSDEEVFLVELEEVQAPQLAYIEGHEVHREEWW